MKQGNKNSFIYHKIIIIKILNRTKDNHLTNKGLQVETES